MKPEKSAYQAHGSIARLACLTLGVLACGGRNDVLRMPEDADTAEQRDGSCVYDAETLQTCGVKAGLLVSFPDDVRIPDTYDKIGYSIEPTATARESGLVGWSSIELSTRDRVQRPFSLLFSNGGTGGRPIPVRFYVTVQGPEQPLLSLLLETAIPHDRVAHLKLEALKPCQNLAIPPCFSLVLAAEGIPTYQPLADPAACCESLGQAALSGQTVMEPNI